MKLRLITIPRSAADEAEGSFDAQAAFNDIMNDMGTGTEGAAAQAEPEQGAPAGNPEQPEGNNSEGNNAPHSAEEKQQYAWTQMSRENKELVNLLGRVAEANGIKFNNTNELKTALNDDVIAKMAEKQNVPVELLQKIQMLEQDAASWKAQQLQNAAAAGFQQLQTEFALDQKALEAFAVELAEAGKNPFEVQVDVLAEYKARHFQDILNAQVQKAVEAALKGDASREAQSTQPAAMQGGSDAGNDDKPVVNSQSDFQTLLNGLMS